MQNILEITFNFPVYLEDETDITYTNQNFKLSDYDGDNSLNKFIKDVNNFYNALGCSRIANNFDKNNYIMYFNNTPTVGLDDIEIDLGIIFNEIKESENYGN